MKYRRRPILETWSKSLCSSHSSPWQCSCGWYGNGMVSWWWYTNSLIQSSPGQHHFNKVRFSQGSYIWDSILWHDPFIQYNLCKLRYPEQGIQILPREVTGIVLYNKNFPWTFRITGQNPLVKVGILSGKNNFNLITILKPSFLLTPHWRKCLLKVLQ